MINIEHKHEDIVLITDDSYNDERFPVYERLFKGYNIIVLDYAIKIKEDNELFNRWLDLQCVGFDEGFLKILKELKPMIEDPDLKDCKFELKILGIMDKKFNNFILG